MFLQLKRTLSCIQSFVIMLHAVVTIHTEIILLDIHSDKLNEYSTNMQY